ncbi:MAG: DUF378 domain-containing protein [Nanoarchaeota archaeon]|nr:DUF378 domain-containing protein [Nanoarchaeota archaeon]
MAKDTLNLISVILCLIAAINLGLVGLFKYNILATIFGGIPILEMIIYIIIGLAGLYMLYGLFKK